MSESKKAPLSLPSSTYRHASFYMLRAPILPAQVFLQVTASDLNSVTHQNESLDAILAAIRDKCYRYIQSLLEQSMIEAALAVASSSIFEGMAYIRKGDPGARISNRKIEKTYIRLLRYLVRMSTRPTPFGLFAGVAVGTFADNSTVLLATSNQRLIRTRPDMTWLLTLIQNVEQSTDILPKLRLVANQMIYLAGARAIVPQADIYGQRDQRSISLKATPVVQRVLEYARYPISYEDLHTKLLEQFAWATPQQIDGLLYQLWDNHFLMSDLRPPLTSRTPARYVLERLTSIPGLQSISADFKKVLQAAAEIDSTGRDNLIDQIRSLTNQQKQVVDEKSSLPFQIDTVLGLRSQYLNNHIGEAAVQAAEILLRLSRFPRGYPHLREYYREFIERYGMEAEIPLLDLLSPEMGLDAPPTYTEPSRSIPPLSRFHRSDTQVRDTILCALVAEAIRNQDLEVQLTESLIQQLSLQSIEESLWPISLEVYLQIHATSLAALDKGDWLAVVSPNYGSLSGGRTFGRFLDCWGSQDLESLQNFIRHEEELVPDAIFAELSYLPTSARGANVAVRTMLRSYEIVVNTTPSVPLEKVLHLNDLVVGVRGGHFYIRSLRLGKEVIACQGNMLNPMGAPNVCRFLTEVAEDKYCLFTPFDWGAASRMPFLPRIVQKRVVLSPAQWNITKSAIVCEHSGSDEARWFNGLQKWRAR